MLTPDDLERVKNYYYQGFPFLKGRIAVRRFDPPRFPDYGFMTSSVPDVRRQLDALEGPLMKDLLAQIPFFRLPTSFPRALCSNLFKDLIDGRNSLRAGPELRDRPKRDYNYLLRMAAPEPGLVLAWRWRNAGARESFFLVTQYPQRMNDGDIHHDIARRQPDWPLPRRTFGRTVRIITAANQFAMATLSFYPDMPIQKKVALADAFGCAAAQAIMGYEAPESLRLYIDARRMRASKPEAKIIDTSDILQSFIKAMKNQALGPQEAWMLAEKCYDACRAKPVEKFVRDHLPEYIKY